MEQPWAAHILNTNAEEIVRRCVPVLDEVATASKTPALWEETTEEGLKADGCKQLAGQARNVLALQAGVQRWFGIRALALMMLVIFPGLAPSTEAWQALATHVSADLTGSIGRRSNKGSKVTRTALCPLELVIKYAGVKQPSRAQSAGPI